MKKCPSCLTIKNIEDYPKDKNRISGIYVYCKECVKQKSKKVYYKNIDHSRELKKKQAANSRDKNIQRSRNWYLLNKERVVVNVKKYRKQNPDVTKKAERKYYEKNKDLINYKRRIYSKTEHGKKVANQIRHNRKQRVKKSEGKHTYIEWENLKEKYNHLCLHCFRSEPEIKLTRDHIIPVSKGGSNYITNIQPLCQSCNSKKRDKIL